MNRFRLLIAAAAGTALLAAAPTGAQTRPKVAGTVGPTAVITVKKGGKKVTTLKAGTYTFVISDKSEFHNFHLTGPGVNKKTGIVEMGTKRWTVRLRKGVYRYVCDPHSSFMKGSFRVT